jgi:hypothetical protein
MGCGSWQGRKYVHPVGVIALAWSPYQWFSASRRNRGMEKGLLSFACLLNYRRFQNSNSTRHEMICKGIRAGWTLGYVTSEHICSWHTHAHYSEHIG